MIKSMAELGKIRRGKLNQDPKYGDVKDMCEPIVFANDTIKAIEVILDKNNFSWKGIQLSEVSSNEQYKLLFRSFNNNQPNASPTAKFSAKFINSKFFKYFSDLPKKPYFSNLQNADVFYKVKQTLEQHREEIEQYVEKNKPNKDEIRKTIITITFFDGENNYYLYDIEFFKNAFIKHVEYQEKQYESDGICSVCGNEDKVYGGVFPIKFFITDKHGFLPDFSPASSPNSFPLCINCLHDVQNGLWYMDEHLYREFVYGLKYYLIPETLNRENTQTFVTFLEEEEKQISSAKSMGNVAIIEKSLLRRMTKLSDIFSFSILFLERSNSAEKILSFIHDILPSRISFIYDKIDRTNSMMHKMDEKYQELFDFDVIRHFFYKSDEHEKGADLDEDFISVVEKIFYLLPIDKSFVFNAIMRRQIQEYKKELKEEKNNLRSLVKEGIEMLYFFEQLGILKISTEVTNKMNGTEKYDAIFDEHFPMFKSPVQRWLFMVGVAAEKMMYIQRKENGKENIHNYFKDFTMTLADFKDLERKIYMKAEYYDKLNYVLPYLQAAESYYALIQDKESINKMTTAELNEYFFAGLVLSWSFRYFLHEADKTVEEDAEEELGNEEEETLESEDKLFD